MQLDATLPIRLLVAQLLVLATLYAAYGLARRALPRAPVALRWSATAALGLWLCSAAFHLLLPLGLFRLPVALVGAALLAAGVRRLGGPGLQEWGALLARDLAWLPRCWKLQRSPLGRALFLVVGFAGLVTLARAALLPPLGWDAVTYHAAKAALWAQSGGPITLDAPGGWGFYRDYFGGGEILSAWAMLVFSADFAVGLVEVSIWILLGVALYALAQELGVRARYRVAGVAYLLALPSIRLAVGAGYVDLTLTLACVLAVLFSVRFSRTHDSGSLILAAMSLGLAAGVKLTAAPAAGLLWLLLAAGAWRSRAGGLGAALAVGTLAAAVVSVPWLAWNLFHTGYPFSPLDLEIGGLRLGQGTDALAWYFDRPRVRPYLPDRELAALARIFPAPWTGSRHLSLLSLLPLLLFAPAWLGLARRRPAAALAILAVVVPLLAFAYSPGFSFVRQYQRWGRFVLPVLCLALVTSLPRGAGGSPWARAYQAFLWAGAMLHLAATAMDGWAPFEQWAVPLVMLGVALLVALLVGLQRSSASMAARGLIALLLVCVAGAGLAQLGQRTRERALARSVAGVSSPRYWVDAIASVDDGSTTRRIALTSGPRRNSDHWHMYF
ncbi:MAG: DUF2029 domain-containing protein, partial [Deltaproteobacteria bacterium]|nr:DUF2029 domain-containing protein [Deltaproteobacteria bacterium]